MGLVTMDNYEEPSTKKQHDLPVSLGTGRTVTELLSDIEQAVEAQLGSVLYYEFRRLQEKIWHTQPFSHI